ncbi:homeobox protein ATH1-like [Prosopis cineraria]|uniref:homeobox protein ATH1-like n=1 Tax=Prosopis cineraria TaxID=364024 RepID=UPI0024100082|nr:homeobox protein ATH1-like [Prosopis cineraria]XP_054797396.1 homeobox protein ATH1-like [Prosopis cineraria]XP_054797397.1 homeobox protein ATH1-like [Prosopis cineraria]XP_054797398.1 homeobox protein ATH1-like [Prosopis cineraria]
MSMENDMFGAPMDMAGRSGTVIDEIPQTPNPVFQGYSFYHNDQTRIMNGISMLAGVQGELISIVHSDAPIMNPACIAHPNSFVPSQGKNIVGDTPLGNPSPRNNSQFQDHSAGATISPASLAAILAARFGLQENLEKSAALSPSVFSLEALAPYMLNSWQDNSNTSLPTFGDRRYDEVPGTRFQTYSSAASLDPNGWTSSNVANLACHAYEFPNFRNELSLSLASSPPPGQRSEVSSDSFELASCSDGGVSRSLCSNRRVNFSQAILGSRYLSGIQEILAQIARYSLENVEQTNCSAACSRARAGGNASSSAPPSRRMTATNNPHADSMFEAQVNSSLARHDAAESKKSQLLTLLQLVDSRYNQCLDEIHTVVSAFHAATELDPQVHARFALQTISTLYKDMRDRISNYILAMGEKFNNLHSEEEKERSTEALFIEKHWALQQLKRKEHQLWRPQRGLPERSVSVLRAWMFQNFLHPYPKDAEKQLLAVKSGLTRSQVSNWFINARVRLWKPLIEEMYTEMNKRKTLRSEEGAQNSHRSSRISLSNQRFTIN